MSLFSVLSVSASGMAAQRQRAELLVQNLANSETTRTPKADPIAGAMQSLKARHKIRRLDLFFKPPFRTAWKRARWKVCK